MGNTIRTGPMAYAIAVPLESRPLKKCNIVWTLVWTAALIAKPLHIRLSAVAKLDKFIAYNWGRVPPSG